MKAKIAQSLGPRSAAKAVELLAVNLERVADSAIPTQDGMKNVIEVAQFQVVRHRHERRADFGLADVFGIHKAGDVVGTGAGMGNGYMARIEKQHEILNGFVGTNWIAGAEFRVPLTRVDGPVLTVVSGVVGYPPELSYPPQSRTEEPAVVVRQKGNSRLVYFSGDIERTMWRTGHTDLARLLQNAIRWVAGANPPVTIQGEGLIEPFAWETQVGFAVHALNYTNPAMHRGWIRDFYPIGAQKVIMKLPQGARVRRVELLRAETDIPFRATNGTIDFTIPKVVDYEVAAMYSA
jgi:hypothetical protein